MRRYSKFGKYPFEKPSPIPIANERNLEFARLQREVQEVQRINAIHDNSLSLARQVIKRIRDTVNTEMSGHRIIPVTDPVSFEVKVILQNLRITFETFENIKAEKAGKDLLLQNQVVKRRLNNLRIRDEGVAEKARIMFETFYNLVAPVFDIYLMDTVLMEGIQNPNLLMSRSKELAKYLELLVGFQEDLRRSERGVFTNINSFGTKNTSDLYLLQKLAKRNKISIFKMRKDRKGYTKILLTIPQLKSRLTRHGISYKMKIKNKMNFGMDSEPTFADLAADAEAKWNVEEAPEAARVLRRVQWIARRDAEKAAKAEQVRRRAQWIKRRAQWIKRRMRRQLDEDAQESRFGRRYKKNTTNNFGMPGSLRTTDRSYAQVAREAAETESLGAPVRVLLDRVLARIEVPAPATNRADLLEAYRIIRMFPQASLESTRAQRDLDNAETRSRIAWRNANETGRGGSRDVETTNPTEGFRGNDREFEFPRITTGRLPRWEMLRYIRNVNPRDRTQTGDTYENNPTGFNKNNYFI